MKRYELQWKGLKRWHRSVGNDTGRTKKHLLLCAKTWSGLSYRLVLKDGQKITVIYPKKRKEKK